MDPIIANDVLSHDPIMRSDVPQTRSKNSTGIIRGDCGIEFSLVMAPRVKASNSEGPSSAKKGARRRQSPELGGGAGFTFEAEAAALYLAALLAEETAPSLEPFVVTQVALQQREFGEPLDDLVVDGTSPEGTSRRLSLQAKSSLTVSAAQSNVDFREVIADSWRTYKKGDFREHVDRFGTITRNISEQAIHALQALCELARASPTAASFDERCRAVANSKVRQVRKVVETLLKEIASAGPTEAHSFLEHFVIIRLDVLHGGATSVNGINSARAALVAEGVDRAADLLDSLRVIARQGAALSASFDRPNLVSDLSSRFPLCVSRRLGPAIEQLSSLASRAAKEIEDRVAGVRLDRATARAKLIDELSRNRFVQIHGLPGAGKSGLIRRAVEDALQIGATLFLKSDRLDGVGWAGYSEKQGIPQVEIPELLIEIGAQGTAILFIDGLDRVDRAHRSIVLDIIQTVFDDERLSGWHVVATVRDAGIEPLRTWLPRSVFTGGIGNVPVEALNDEEATTLATADPSLQPLLFGPRAIREIARRPFFTKVVSQALKSGHADQGAPQSEVDLANGWWERGGYDTTGRDALERQRGLIDLAAVRAEHLNEPIPMRALKPETLGTIESLKIDGILQSTSTGHSVQFAHDIFFEWAFLHRLIDLGDGWKTALAEAGEPPVLGRVVELLSQSALSDFDRWHATLDSLERSGLRTQWLRAWLLAPVSMPDFEQWSERYWEILARDKCRLLQKALVWFQAERTSPNIGILEGAAGSSEVNPENRILVADLLGWPSDYNTWGRLIRLIDSRVDELPGPLYPHVISIFEVWQNALADVKNSVSELIVDRASTWLTELEENERRTDRRNPLPPPWRGLEKGRGELQKRLRQIIFRAARAFPDQAAAYLQRLLTIDDMRDKLFKQVFTYAPVLSETHPDLLVDVALKYLREELPGDRVDRERTERDESAKRREAIRAKPESQRTPEENLFLDSVFHSIGYQGIDWHEWSRLAVGDDSYYFPASPLREPFHSLFMNAPASGMRLLRDLSNHAMEAWRQLHRLEQRGTPIPIKLAFPWGTQLFWGNTREYLWARGHWAPKPLTCAYLALDSWARRQLEDGRDVDAVIQDIVVGNNSIAALGAAVCVALRAFVVSDATRPLLHSPRLWRADLQRFVEESGFGLSSQIGFSASDRQHAQAVDAMSGDTVRQRELRQLVAAEVLQSQATQSNSMLDVIRAFAEDLPFEFEEDQSNPEVREALERAAAVDVEFFKAENYHLIESEKGENTRAIAFVNPQSETAEARARLAESQRHLSAHALFGWANQSFETGKINDALSIDAAVGLARQYDHRRAFSASSREDPQASIERGALAGAAAVIVAFARDDTRHVKWARKILDRAFAMPEAADQMWLAQSVIPWHPGIFVARAAAAELKDGSLRKENAERLLRLIAHPLECVGLEAITLSFGLWEQKPRFAWCALCLAFSICHLPPRDEIYRTGYGRTSNSKVADRAKAVRAILSSWTKSTSWPELLPPPPAWLKMGSKAELDDRRQDDPSDGDFEEFELQEDESVGWREPRGLWNDQFAAKIIDKIPVEVAANEESTKSRLTDAIETLLGWTIEKLSPSWESPPYRRSSDANIFEWTHSLSSLLGVLSGHIDEPTLDDRFLKPVCALRDEPCFALLASLTDRFICAHILDSTEISSNARLILDRSTDRLLQIRELQPDSYRAGELYGFDIPLLARALLCVSVERAMGAARYVNGDWREIGFILPTVDRIVRAAGWSATIMTDFLTLTDRARACFPAANFADDIQSALDWGEGRLTAWQTTIIPGRIAGLIQHFSERDAPLNVDLARKLLRVLDALVDMGDRRSAALQTSAAFRDVRLRA